MHSFWPGWCCRDHQADRSLCYGDKGMDDNELSKMACWQDSFFDVTDTYSVISLQHQRFLLVTTASLHLPQIANLVPFMMNICLPLFFLPPAQHQQHSKSAGYEDNCHLCRGSGNFPTWLLHISAMWTFIYTHKEMQRVQNAAARVIAELYITIYNYLKTSLATGRIPHKVEDPVIDILYRALHDLVPTYTTELLVPYTPPRTQSTEQILECIKSPRLKNFGARSFKTTAPALWNSLGQFGESDPSAENPDLR